MDDRGGRTERADDPGDGDLDDLATEAGTAARRVSGTVAGVSLVVMHGAVGYLTASLGLVAPPWAVVSLLIIWAVIGAVAWRERRRHPIATMLAPFVTMGIVLAAVSLGDAFLGWTA